MHTILQAVPDEEYVTSRKSAVMFVCVREFNREIWEGYTLALRNHLLLKLNL